MANCYILVLQLKKSKQFINWPACQDNNFYDLGWGGWWEGGSEWGDTCATMADSCQCMAKTTTIL